MFICEITVRIHTAYKPDWILLDKSAYCRIILSCSIEICTGFILKFTRRKRIHLCEVRIQLRLDLAERRVSVSLNGRAGLVCNLRDAPSPSARGSNSSAGPFPFFIFSSTARRLLLRHAASEIRRLSYARRGRRPRRSRAACPERCGREEACRRYAGRADTRRASA